jgi:GT2 family glycosyltransferase
MESLEHNPDSAKIAPRIRPQASGKFLYAGIEKMPICGVTYGAFEPDAEGNEYRDDERIDRDFGQMAENGVTAVRIPHTMPPRCLLDAAGRHGLRVMVGLSIEQEIGYFIDGNRDDVRRIEATLRRKVRSCREHPALLCYALGNEIPASIVRWLGHGRVERILERMYRIVKEEDPGCMVTYVNYPTTEYLHLPFLDLLCFNVYLESQDRLAAYLARLQNIAGDRPLLMSELGLDAMRNGEAAQAETLAWQIRTSFDAGCAGVFVFSWTDEWFRAGSQVEDWAFGITDIERRPKPALASVRDAFLEGPLPQLDEAPRISVVVCTYNGSASIRECCERLKRLEYPDFETIVVDDGSDDGAGEIAAGFGFRVIRAEENEGLGSARNRGLAAATGEIVAYIDDDAFPDKDWLLYIAAGFSKQDCVAVGGPNVTPPDDGGFARCVAYAPGNPSHVLSTDTIAEQLPGCNLAIRRSALEEVDGFDPQFRAAGDDVDICMRLRERGWTLAYCPAAMVWHRRRGTLAAFLAQQAGYGAAEALLERKWSRTRFSAAHVSRQGRVYGTGAVTGLSHFRARIYHGVWGNAPFQSVYADGTGSGLALHRMPGLYLVLACLMGLSLLGIVWSPMRVALPLFALGLVAIVLEAVAHAYATLPAAAASSGMSRLKCLVVMTMLFLLQPAARFWGRLKGPHRSPGIDSGPSGMTLPWPRTGWLWSENWIGPEVRIAAVEEDLRTHGVPLSRGGDFDAWDLELHGGPFGGARVAIAVEDHSGATQMIRYRISPRARPTLLVAASLALVLSVFAAVDSAWLAAIVLGIVAAAIVLSTLWSCGRAMSWGLRALGGIVT